MSTTTYVFFEKYERYQHFSDEKKTPYLLQWYIYVCIMVMLSMLGK